MNDTVSNRPIDNSPTPPGWGWQFVAVFLVVFAVLDFGYQQSRETALETVLIDVVTVKTSAAVLSVIAPLEQVQAVEHRLVSPRARMSVLNGCEGTESALLIIAAVLAFAARWRHKAVGLLLGVALVFILNQIRIAWLYLTLRHAPEWFDALHGYIAPGLIVFILGFYFLAWTRRIAPPDAAHAA